MTVMTMRRTRRLINTAATARYAENKHTIKTTHYIHAAHGGLAVTCQTAAQRHPASNPTVGMTGNSYNEYQLSG